MHDVPVFLYMIVVMELTRTFVGLSVNQHSNLRPSLLSLRLGSNGAIRINDIC